MMVASCEEKNKIIVYKKNSKEKFDETCTWLNEKNNFYNKKFMPTFYDYYNKKIKEKDYEGARKALKIVSIKKSYFSSYDKKFTNTINYFSSNYRSQVSAIKTTFIDSYFGCFYDDEGDFKKALSYYKKITKFEPLDFNSCKDIAYAYYNVSYCYYSMGKQNLALENNFKALHYYTQINDTNGIGYVYTSFSLIYSATNNFKKAIENNDKAIGLFKKEKDTSNVYISLFNKILMYEDAQNSKMYSLVDSTYTSFKKSKIKDDVLKISIYSYYAGNLLKNDKIDEAKNILDEIKPIVSNLNSPSSTREYDTAFAEYEIKKNGGNINTEIILKTIPGLKENENYQAVINFYTVLKNNALQKKDYKSALQYNDEIVLARDSVASNQMMTKVIELDGKYKVEKKENQIALQNKTIQNNNFSIALLITILIGFLLSVITISFIKKQKKLKLEKIKSLQFTKQLLEKTEEERQRIASDLHDSVSHELLNLKNSIEEKSEMTNKKIDAIINDIRSISRNLHPIMFDKIGLKSSVEQLVERAQSFNNFMVTAEIDYNSSLPTSSELQLYRILQESLSNIIKYANAMA
uniref:tetratricopeptide repeat-containing sensor histidine kinase n=1 Tax=Flavobacterium sp. TaxID=239 RepID=UPI003751D59A